MAKWMLKQKKADFTGLAEKFGVSPLFIRLLINRDITSEEDIYTYIHGNEELFYDPFLLKDMSKACDILAEKINSHKKIRIVGDYDVDGVCATAILMKGLNLLGANADYRVPHRINDGYGLNINIIDEAFDDGIDTIVTCDNGISATNEIAKAKEYGMTVIITDHHEVPFEMDNDKKQYILPPADAIIDPKQEEDTYPFSGICGAYVAYKLISSLSNDVYARRLSKYDEIKERRLSLLSELTELAAFATIADIMELRGENRELVKKGLDLMSDSKNTGLKALIEKTALSGKKINSYHCGFVLGPCINASGRVDTAERALELLLCDDKRLALVMAEELTALNESRKRMTKDAVENASIYITDNNMENNKILVVYLPDCHESVAGIVAGKIREKYSRPVFVVTKAKEGVKGSARGVETYNIYEEMTKVAYLFTKYGGHSQAAGFSMDSEEKISQLSEALNENCTLELSELRDVISIDADAPFSYCTPALLECIELMQPTGHGNNSCTFARKNVTFISLKTFGAEGKVGKYRVKDSTGEISELTLFNRNDEVKKLIASKYGENEVLKLCAGKGEALLSVAYHPSWNEYNGTKTLQLIIDDFC